MHHARRSVGSQTVVTQMCWGLDAPRTATSAHKPHATLCIASHRIAQLRTVKCHCEPYMQLLALALSRFTPNTSISFATLEPFYHLIHVVCYRALLLDDCTSLIFSIPYNTNTHYLDSELLVAFHVPDPLLQRAGL
jgi:hypothetical protein